MPFEVFRRHQKKLLAVLAIFAMVAFTLDFSLFRSQLGNRDENPVVATLYGRRVRRSEVLAMLAQRNRAKRFLALLTGAPDLRIFGDLDTRSLVDALILQHEADRLGMPVDGKLALDWLKAALGPAFNPQSLDTIYRKNFANEVTDVQLLEDIANQIRLTEVRNLPGNQPVTPLDVYRAYCDQYQRVSAKVIAFPVEQFLAQAPQPGEAEIRAYYETYKDLLPDPQRDTPGFKIPQRVRVEFAMLDADALARQIEPTLTDAELRGVFTARPDDFPVPPPELPQGLFAGEPKLTPRLRDPFLDVRADVARTVGRERAQQIVDRVFDALREKALEAFADRYLDAVEANQEAKESGGQPKALPTPGAVFETTVAAIAKDPAGALGLSDDPALARIVRAIELDLAFERTPLLDRERAAGYGPIGRATRGGGRPGGGTTFVELVFDPKRALYENFELTDDLGRRFLGWKIEDVPARVPDLDAIRDQVVRAWRLEKARGLALRAAETFARKVREAGGDPDRLAQAEGRPVVATTPEPRLQPGAMLGSTFQPEPPRPSAIPQLPDAGPDLRQVLFALQPGAVAVAPNQTKTIFYVLTYNDRSPVNVQNLYGEFGPRFSLELGVQDEVNRAALDSWMQALRSQAGLPEDWVPPDEAEREAVGRTG